MISVRRMQRSEGDIRPHKVYLFLISITTLVDLAMSVCPPVRLYVSPSFSTQASLSVLKLSG